MHPVRFGFRNSVLQLTRRDVHASACGVLFHTLAQQAQTLLVGQLLKLAFLVIQAECLSFERNQGPKRTCQTLQDLRTITEP